MQKIITIKFTVPVSTTASNPLILITEIPLPIINKIGVYGHAGGGVFTETSAGVRISSAEVGQFFPSPMSNDSLATGAVNRTIPVAPMINGQIYYVEGLDVKLNGPEYKIKIEFNNNEAAQILYGFLLIWCSEEESLKVETPKNEP